MPRSAIDATRFTATKPHAFSKLSTSPASRFNPFASKQPSCANTSPSASASPSSSASASTSTSTSAAPPPPPSSSSSSGSPSAPPRNFNETPKQKVERLRAEAHARRLNQQFSRTDRILGSGRVWADRFHRTAVYSLIAISGIAGALTVYSITSLALYNSRQKQLWLERELEKLHNARQAFIDGQATPEQLELLQKEKEAEELKRFREFVKRDTFYYKARQWLFGGLQSSDQVNPGDQPSDNAPAQPFVADDNTTGTVEIISLSHVTPDPSSSSPPSADDAGPDASSSKSWTSWLTGR